jgi:hypothetical protein
MTSQTKRNSILGLIAMAALSLYVLACSTAFSPDDQHVLYPAFDAQSGAVGIADYDRSSSRSEMLFLPATVKDGDVASSEPWLMRPQWLPDGRNIVVAWAGEGPGSDHDLTLAVLPFGAMPRTTRMYHLTDMKDVAARLVLPLPMVGNRLFLFSASNSIVRLDLMTGACTRHAFADARGDIVLYPSPRQDAVFYVEQRKDDSHGAEFGRINADTLARTPLMSFTNEPADGGFLGCSADGKRVAIAEKTDAGLRLVVLDAGKQVFTQMLTSTNEDVKFGSFGLSPRGDALLASYVETHAGETNSTLGLMEVPFNDAPKRRTVLLKTTKLKDEAALYTQAGVSHDGKTAAVATTYLACEDDDFKRADCALFLVDLSDPNRKVTKVTIPIPAKTTGLQGR